MKPPGRPERVEILDLQGGLIDEVPFSPRSTDEFTFDWENFEPPKGLFYLRVVGVDDDSNVFYRASPTALSAVLPGLFNTHISPLCLGECSFVNQRQQLLMK